MKNIKLTLAILIVLTILSFKEYKPIKINNTLNYNLNLSKKYFSSEDGNFKVNFSGKPTETSEVIKTEAGNIELHMFMYEKSATEIEMIAYSDYPTSIIKANTPNDLLNSAKNGAVNNLNAKITEEYKTIFDRNPCIDFKADNKQFYVIYKIFLKNNRLYQIAIMRDGSYPSKKSIKKFVETFKLTK